MHGLNQYDSQARMQGFNLQGFTKPDPLCELYYDWTPYGYCGGKPIRYIDPDGKRQWPVEEKYKGYKREHSNNWRAARKRGRKHKGVDINYTGAGEADRGAPIVATHDGKVSKVTKIGRGDKDGGGNRVKIISSEGEVSTYYMHLDKIDSNIKVGTEVSEGDQIGTMGKSGNGNSEPEFWIRNCLEK